MPNRCFSFFKRQDQLGQGVAFNFRGESGYGTVMGGVLSFCTSIFFAVFIIIQLYAFFMATDYNQQISVTYMDRDSRENYVIPTSFFLPTFAVVENIMGDPEDWVINDSNNWSVVFATYVDNELSGIIAAVNCKELVDSWTDLEPGARESIIAEIPFPDDMLCPELDSFSVMGGAITSDYLELLVFATEQARSTSGLIGSSGIYTAEITRYFNAQEYQQNGYQNAIALTEDINLFNSLKQTFAQKLISKEDVSFYTFSWLDTSAITLFDFGASFANYKVEKTTITNTIWTENSQPIYVLDFFQSRIINEVTWSVQSLDLVLGLVGGLSAIIWAILAIVLGGYESFKFENSLIGSVYPTSPQDFPSDAGEATNPYESERKAKSAMMRTVAERGKYWYSYREYLLISFLKAFCCCLCRNKQWYQEKVKRLERHEAASAKLADEIDIVKLLYVQRVGQFIAKLILKKHQRALVTSFKKYQIDDLGQAAAKTTVDGGATLLEPSIQEDGMVSDFDAFAGNELLTEDQLKLLKEISDKFSPEDSAADLSILYEVTGFQAESQNFEYWENYQDFEELGDTNLVRDDKNERLIALTSKNQGKKKINFEGDVDT